jgi:hypothetical protein
LMNDQNYCVDKVLYLLSKNMRWNTKSTRLAFSFQSSTITILWWCLHKGR